MSNLNKRNLTIEKQMVRNFVLFIKCLQTPLPFYATQIINSSLNSMLSANHKKGEEFQPMEKFLYPLLFL